MRVQFIGVNRRTGTSSKTGNAYDMSKIIIAVPLTPVQKESMQYTGFGLETREIDLNPECLAMFADVKPFATVDIVVEPKPTNFNHTWCNGVNA